MALIGIDIGGTHTRIRTCDADFLNQRNLFLRTADWITSTGLSDPVSAANLYAYITQIGGSPDDSLAAGAHGCDSQFQIAGFVAALRTQHHGPLEAVNDAALLAYAADEKAAVGVIAGTGSVVVGATQNGDLLTAGGHGWMIADPGSAPGISRDAVLAVLDRADAGLAPDPLTRALLDHYSVDDLDDLPAIFTKNASIHFWAQAAPNVFKAAAEGSTLADQVISTAAHELARSVANVLARGAHATSVVTAGGVIVNQPRFQEHLRTALVAEGVDLPLIVLTEEPVVGALKLARKNATSHSDSLEHQLHGGDQ
ncbi:MAG: BadF/BadG/BcrA/BcrD ATPase family protein [Canibacter sp.]